MLDQDIEESITRYIKHIRQMSILTDEQLIILLRQKAIEDPDIFNSLKDGAQKKMFADMKKIAKDIKGVKFARRIDDFV